VEILFASGNMMRCIEGADDKVGIRMILKMEILESILPETNENELEEISVLSLKM
jgi:hypothetical protein